MKLLNRKPPLDKEEFHHYVSDIRMLKKLRDMENPKSQQWEELDNTASICVKVLGRIMEKAL